MSQRLEEIFMQIMIRFREFRDPKTNEKFPNIFVKEIFMGAFAQAYRNYVKDQENRTQLLTSQTQELNKLRGMMQTPAGHLIDADDLKSIDAFIVAFGGSTSQVASSTQAKPQREPASKSAPATGVPVPEAPSIEP